MSTGYSRLCYVLLTYEKATKGRNTSCERDKSEEEYDAIDDMIIETEDPATATEDAHGDPGYPAIPAARTGLAGEELDICERHLFVEAPLALF